MDCYEDFDSEDEIYQNDVVAAMSSNCPRASVSIEYDDELDVIEASVMSASNQQGNKIEAFQQKSLLFEISSDPLLKDCDRKKLHAAIQETWLAYGT